MNKIIPTLLPGSEWLYLKIYCSEQTANQLFKNALNKLLKNKTWFFIRYHDPDFHLRIRMKIKSEEHNETTNKIYKIFNPLIEKRVVWKIQYDTYQREIDRYSEKFMLFSEDLFCIQSKFFVLNDVTFFSYNHDLKFYHCLNLVHTLVEKFILSADSRLSFFKNNYELFKKELLNDKNLTEQLNSHFKSKQLQLNNIFLSENNINNIFSSQIEKAIDEHHINVNEVSNQFLSSHVHMLVNRYFTNDQRKYEYIIYHHLFKYFSMLKWHKNNMNENE